MKRRNEKQLQLAIRSENNIADLIYKIFHLFLYHFFFFFCPFHYLGLLVMIIFILQAIAFLTLLKRHFLDSIVSITIYLSSLIIHKKPEGNIKLHAHEVSQSIYLPYFLLSNTFQLKNAPFVVAMAMKVSEMEAKISMLLKNPRQKYVLDNLVYHRLDIQVILLNSKHSISSL